MEERDQHFLVWAFDLRQQFASQGADSNTKYNPAILQNLFLPSFLTWLWHGHIQILQDFI